MNELEKLERRGGGKKNLGLRPDACSIEMPTRLALSSSRKLYRLLVMLGCSGIEGNEN